MIKRPEYAILSLALCSILLSQSSLGDSKRLDQLTIEQLLDVEITSASRKQQKLSHSATAVYVISAEDLRRTGVTNIADALKMAPGIHVARIDANKWAVTSRGFNGRFANKLLALMDGRSIYTPTFAGVYWETQTRRIDDIERIEVIRGAGATLWGANAVNGVINIITKQANQSQGTHINAQIGSFEKAQLSLRHGTQLNDKHFIRSYISAFNRDSFELKNGADAQDQWDMVNAGFRLDTHVTEKDQLSIWTDLYSASIGQTLELADPSSLSTQIFEDQADSRGGVALLRWQRLKSLNSDISFQTYIDVSHRDEAFVREKRQTFDIDYQHRQLLGRIHDLIWGFNYRHSEDDFKDSFSTSLNEDKTESDLSSAFIQDEISLKDGLYLITAGAKLEHYEGSKTEIQPSLRFFSNLSPQHKFWASVSKAVRSASRIEQGSLLNTTFLEVGNKFNITNVPVLLSGESLTKIKPEELVSYELGYRVLPSLSLSLDFAFFYNEYEELRFFNQLPLRFMLAEGYIWQSFEFANGLKGRTHGMETSLVWQTDPWGKLDLVYSYTETDLDRITPFDYAQNTDAPRHQLSIRHNKKLSSNISLNSWLSYSGEFKAININSAPETFVIDDYWSLDLRLTYQANKELEMYLSVNNLLSDKQLQFVQEFLTTPTETPSHIFMGINWWI